MTKYGQRLDLLIQIRDFTLSFICVLISLVLGGVVLHELEHEREQEDIDKWHNLLIENYNNLNATEV
jgi:hypothetical protein